jgi:hypothetical protein
MIFYIRDAKNNDVFELELWTKIESGRRNIEIKSSIHVAGYSKFLVANQGSIDDIVSDFSELEDMRGWMWEQYFATKKNDGSQSDYIAIHGHIRSRLTEVAIKYGLMMVEDY